MERKKVYLVLDYFASDDGEDLETTVFENYLDAVDFYEQAISRAKTSDSWIGDAFTDGELDKEVEHSFVVGEAPVNRQIEKGLCWEIWAKNDFYLRAHIQLRILEVM